MAQRVQVMLVDDLDGSTANESVTFGLDGVTYKIDLSTANATELRDALAPWIGAGRKLSGRAQRGTKTARRLSDGETAKMREWAKSHGYQVSDRGRIAADIQAAYHEAGN